MRVRWKAFGGAGGGGLSLAVLADERVDQVLRQPGDRERYSCGWFDQRQMRQKIWTWPSGRRPIFSGYVKHTHTTRLARSLLESMRSSQQSARVRHRERAGARVGGVLFCLLSVSLVDRLEAPPPAAQCDVDGLRVAYGTIRGDKGHFFSHKGRI